MSSFVVITTESTVGVVSPTLTVDALVATIAISPSQVISNVTLAQADYDSGAAMTTLQAVSDNIQEIMDGGKVIAASPAQSLDASGLLQDAMDFTVAYQPPGSAVAPLTRQVEITITELGGGLVFSQIGAISEATVKIDAAYQQLVEIYNGTLSPSSSPPVSGGGGSGTAP